MDKYDAAIQYLNDNPGEIHSAWQDPTNHEGGVLFQYATPTGSLMSEQQIKRIKSERLALEEIPKFVDCGCLTQVRSGQMSAYTTQITSAIRADTSLPTHPQAIRLEHLPRFAEWQRRLDKEIRGVV